MRKEEINQFYESGLFSEIDIHFAKLMMHLADADAAEIFLAAALVSRATGNGNTCLDLSRGMKNGFGTFIDEKMRMICPEYDVWKEKLVKSRVVGRPGDERPLILDGEDRLYLYRYYNYEKRLSDSIKDRCRREISDINRLRLKKSVNRLFPHRGKKTTDWQAVASITAALNKFCVISGGPGTGKTFTVAKILALLLEQAEGKRLRIFLSAPTGKAAARLKESMTIAKQRLRCDEKIKAAFPREAFTLHRMLKSIPDSPYFQYNAQNPLPADVVVIDEASMVDLALMSKLVDAIPSDARIILIGDKDQLASVDAGSVLGDICNRDEIHAFSEIYAGTIEELTGERVKSADSNRSGKNRIQDCMVELKESYRFPEGSGIGEFSRAVRLGDADAALEMLKHAPEKTIKWKKMVSPEDFRRAMEAAVIENYTQAFQTDDPERVLAYYNRFKVLCAIKKGPLGVRRFNQMAEQMLHQEGLIKPEGGPDAREYKGKPILITRNDYHLDLYNGDTGVIMPDAGSGAHELSAFFPGASNRIRPISTYRLPPHETTYAMTVHKSQGSEFENVVMVFPDRDFPVLTRELIYTGVTRARENVWLWGTEPVMKNAISRKIERTSGLRDALWK